ncbi:hypothetical protein K438DRAFT_1989763 [Mycena galopus ATCC 62051]|nr:hypothetical protein K438DRAFT_1989763 [Mycena galopus ATCC 62051]
MDESAACREKIASSVATKMVGEYAIALSGNRALPHLLLPLSCTLDRTQYSRCSGGDQAERWNTITSIDSAMKNKGETPLIHGDGSSAPIGTFEAKPGVPRLRVSLPLARALCLPLPLPLTFQFHLLLPLPLPPDNPRMCSAFLPALPLVAVMREARV